MNMIKTLVARMGKWPGLFIFHFKRLRFRVKHGKIRAFNLLCYMESFHWMQLAKYHQYNPKPIVFDKLPDLKVPSEWPSISIVTPSYNQAEYLEETIKSVLDQSYPKLSYAVVDGGSDDGSAEILNRYKDHLDYAVSEPDDGQSDAIAKGMNRLDGEIQGYLNSDDLLAPGTLKYVGAFFAQHPEIDVVYGHRIIVDAKTQEIGRWILPRHYEESTKHFDYVPQETMFWRASLSKRVGGINPAYYFAMDWDLILRFQAAGARFKRLPYFLACFRAHDSQKSQAGTEKGKKEIAELMARSGGDSHWGREYEAAHWKYRKRAFLTSLLLALRIRV